MLRDCWDWKLGSSWWFSFEGIFLVKCRGGSYILVGWCMNEKWGNTNRREWFLNISKCRKELGVLVGGGGGLGCILERGRRCLL